MARMETTILEYSIISSPAQALPPRAPRLRVRNSDFWKYNPRTMSYAEPQSSRRWRLNIDHGHCHPDAPAQTTAVSAIRAVRVIRG